MFKGDKAPFDGVLFDDESVRQIDVDLLEKDLCEKKLSNQSCEMTPGIDIGGVVIGAGIGAALVCAMTKCL